MGRIIPDMPSLAFAVLVLAIGLLVLIPTRRLFLAGWTPAALTAYFLGMAAFAFVVAELRGPARYLLPILVLAYIAQFITAREGISRLRDRFGSGPPARPDPPGAGRPDDRVSEPKNVTPKDGRPPEARG
jgi:hypothetical protein